MPKFYIRTYTSGSHTIQAPDIISALNQFIRATGINPAVIHTVVDSREDGR